MPNPRFFAADEYERTFPRDTTIVVVSEREGDQEIWQAETGFWFRLADGYIGGIPPGYDGSGLAINLARSALRPFQRRQILPFLRSHGFTLQRQFLFRHGLLKSELWRRQSP